MPAIGEVPMQWQLKITDFNSAKRVGKGNGQGPSEVKCSGACNGSSKSNQEAYIRTYIHVRTSI